MNKLNKSIKKALLALALTSLSFSTAQAVDYVIPNYVMQDLNGEIHDSGSFQMFGMSAVFIDNSQLGNASGGRWSMYGENSTPYTQSMAVYNSALYFSSFEVGQNFILTISVDSFFYADSIKMGYDGQIRVTDTQFVVGTVKCEELVLDNSSWTAAGSSKSYLLSLKDSTVNYTITSATDSIVVTNLTYYGSNHYNFDFSDDFIDSIATGAGYYDMIFADTIVSSVTNVIGIFNINVADSNSKYTWDVTYLGANNYRISNFELIAIPEPSTYAAVFGLIALAFVAYKRRK